MESVPEVVTEAVKVLDKAAEIYGHTCDYTELLMGGASIDVHGVPMTDETIAQGKGMRCGADGFPSAETPRHPRGIGWSRLSGRKQDFLRFAKS